MNLDIKSVYLPALYMCTPLLDFPQLPPPLCPLVLKYSLDDSKAHLIRAASSLPSSITTALCLVSDPESASTALT